MPRAAYIILPLLALGLFMVSGLLILSLYWPTATPVADPSDEERVLPPKPKAPQKTGKSGTSEPKKPAIRELPGLAAKQGEPSPLRLFEDTRRKQKDFWLEQTMAFETGQKPGPLLDLYLSIDPETLSGTRLRLSGNDLRLEQVITPADGATRAETKELSSARLLALPADWMGNRATLGVLKKGNELTAWWNGRVVMTLPENTDYAGSSAVQVVGPAIRALESRTLVVGPLDFRDGFMRAKGNSVWQPWTGRWELTALAFPERSANPFSMRASFDNQPAANDRLYRGRTKGRNHGLGVQFGMSHGTLQISRITGGSPAARAGLQEDDTIVGINGRTVRSRSSHMLMYLMGGGFHQRTVNLRVHRPGEPRLLDIQVKTGMFNWGTPLEGQALQPIRPADEALVVTGQGSWSEYAAEVSMKALGQGGGGLAVAVTSPRDLLLLRWNGAASEDQPAKEGLELIHRQDGQDKILASRELRYRPYEFYRLRLDWRGDRVRAAVDGVEVFDVKVPQLRCGRLGLYARRGDPIFFDDVRVTSHPEALADERPERKVHAIFAREVDMESWANPALEWQRHERTPWSVHSSRFPGEQMAVLNHPKFDVLTIRPLLHDEQLAPYTKGTHPPAPPAELRIEKGRATLRGSGWTPAEVAIPVGPIRRIALRASPSGARVDIDGVKLETPNAPGAKAQAFGNRIAVAGLKNLGATDTAHVTSTGTLEYTFDRAPVDWKVESGRWGLLNKWICDPRWSWFGGRTATIGAVWNKHVFEGDQSIEVNVALMMRRDEPPYERTGYERAGDFNLVLCGDGSNLHSGYTLICGGGENRWTRLYRNGKQVAESLLERHRFPSDRVRQPDKPELHQRWFRLRLEKRGRTISFYRDGDKAFSFEDPDPLAGGRAGFWTCENGVLMARARIAAEKIKPKVLESRRATLYDDGTVVNLFDAEVHTQVAKTPLPAMIEAALNQPPDRFAPTDCPGSGEPAAGGSAWRVTNGTGGGPMALQWRTNYCDPASLGIVRFAIRIQPGTAVDLCLKDLSTGTYYRWRMTGPEQKGAAVPLVGHVPGVKADGRWHAVQFNLGPSWRAYWKERGFRTPQRRFRPLIACLDNGQYAVAGLTGNGVGAAYAVSQMSFYRTTDVDRDPPQLSRVIWPYDKEGDGRSVVIDFADPGGSGIRFDQLSMEINRQPVRIGWSYDERKQQARIDLLSVPGQLPLRDGSRLELSIPYLIDYAGNRIPQRLTRSWTFQAAAAASKPAQPPDVSAFLVRSEAAPQIKGLDKANTRNSEPERVTVTEVEDAPPWALKKQSIRVTAQDDGTHLGLRVKTPVIDLAHWPYLAIEYRMPGETPVSLDFNAYSPNELELGDRDETWRTLILGDIGDPSDSMTARFGEKRTYLPRPKDFVQDDTWRRLEVPLHQLLSSQAGPGPWKIYGLRFHDNGWLGSRKGMGYAIHAVYSIPASRSDSIKFKWSLRDLAGNLDYASAIDENPDKVPTGKEIMNSEPLSNAIRRKQTSGTLTKFSDGWKYLHVRLKNAAGRWSPTAHFKFRIDNTPPRVARTAPADGSRFAGRTIRVFLDEDHAIDLKSVRMRVNTRTFSVAHREIRYDAAAKALILDTERAGILPWANGARVTVTLERAADALGNARLAPHRFTFIADRTVDRDGPKIGKVRFCALDGRSEYRPPRPILTETSTALDFEETVGHVHAMEGCRLDWVNDPHLAAFGNRSVRVVCLGNDANVEVMLHNASWYADRRPQLHFDYRADPGMKVDLQALVMGKWYTFRFLGTGGDRPLRHLANIVADGKWHHASVNLYDTIARAVPDLPVPIISKIKLSAHGEPGCRRGATLWLDNLMLSPPEGQGGMFEWQPAKDPSDVRGYAVKVDRFPNTIPLPRLTTQSTNTGIFAAPGTWYVHIRAQDQAGNWGPTRHFRTDF